MSRVIVTAVYGREAPAVVPVVPLSASGLSNTVWKAAPTSASVLPTSAPTRKQWKAKRISQT